MSTVPTDRAIWGVVPLRLLLGLGFVLHGVAKLERGPERFAELLDALDVPAPRLAAWLTTVLEVCGGLGLIVGVQIVPLCTLLAAVMATAMVKVHLPLGFSAVRLRAVTPHGPEFGPVGYELNLLYLAGLLAVALARGGPLSVDGWLRARIARARVAPGALPPPA